MFPLENIPYLGQGKKVIRWVCSSNGRVIPSQGIGNGIDARLIQFFLSLGWVYHFDCGFCALLRDCCYLNVGGVV